MRACSVLCGCQARVQERAAALAQPVQLSFVLPASQSEFRISKNENENKKYLRKFGIRGIRKTDNKDTRTLDIGVPMKSDQEQEAAVVNKPPGSIPASWSGFCQRRFLTKKMATSSDDTIKKFIPETPKPRYIYLLAIQVCTTDTLLTSPSLQIYALIQAIDFRIQFSRY